MPKRAGNMWKKPRRIEYLEKIECYYLFCEGQKTEPLYFGGFKRLIEANPIYKNMILVDIVPCGLETLRVMKRAEEYVQKEHIEKGQIWCIYDKDSFPARDFNSVVERAKSLNARNDRIKYCTAWSNECIEYWFILYFESYKSNNSRSEYIKFLDKRLKKLGYKGYKKNMVELFDILRENGDEELAIRRAKERINECGGIQPADIAPGTTVYELVEEFRKYI